MIDLIVSDIVNTTSAVWTSSSRLLLVLLAVVAAGQGFTMPKLGDVFGRAAQGLLLLALLFFIVSGLMSEFRFTLDLWETLVIDAWNDLMAMDLLKLLGLYIAMFLGVLIVFGLKSIIRR